MSGKGTRDELVTLLVVVEHPGRQADRLVLDAVERLRAVAHLLRIGQVVACSIIFWIIEQCFFIGIDECLFLPKGGLPPTPMEEYGHTFASDLVINYANMQREGLIRPGQLLLFASAGIGFTWGATIARA